MLFCRGALKTAIFYQGAVLIKNKSDYAIIV